jgi:hypothetical protein
VNSSNGTSDLITTTTYTAAGERTSIAQAYPGGLVPPSDLFNSADASEYRFSTARTSF